MSLILNEFLNNKSGPFDVGSDSDQENLEYLDHYLAVVENNKKASFFVPNDALVALDMAGFALGQLAPGKGSVPVSAARLALALVQPGWQAPVQ